MCVRRWPRATHSRDQWARISTIRSTLGILWAAPLSYPRASLPFGAVTVYNVSDEEESNVNRDLFKNIERLRQLRIEHRDLDDVISRLSMDFKVDELQMKRLKRRKLMLKDQIARLESQLIPDLNA
jgi:hypothetical protein